jgi:hypothetical protein
MSNQGINDTTEQSFYYKRYNNPLDTKRNTFRENLRGSASALRNHHQNFAEGTIYIEESSRKEIVDQLNYFKVISGFKKTGNSPSGN